MNLTTVYDCTGENLGSFPVPPGALLAGYVTGSGPVPWSAAQLSVHPNAVRIDQAPTNTATNETADVLDVEQAAATIEDIPAWVHAAWVSYRAGYRPGQRTPTIYSYETNLTPIANALNAAGITNGVNFWLSQPMSRAQAEIEVNTASGPFPIVAVQYEFDDTYDISVASMEWLGNVSKPPEITQPTLQQQTGWLFCHKCQSLFWGPGQAQSVCPRGAQHDGSGSYQYTLGYVR